MWKQISTYYVQMLRIGWPLRLHLALSDVLRKCFLNWCLLCLHAGDDPRGAGGIEGLVLWSGTSFHHIFWPQSTQVTLLQILPSGGQLFIKWLGTMLYCLLFVQTYSQLAHPIQQAKAMGLQFHSKILDIDNIDVSYSTLHYTGLIVKPWLLALYNNSRSF